MTCNFCGSALDDNEVECPYCGHKTGVETAPVNETPADKQDAEMAKKFSVKLPSIPARKSRSNGASSGSAPRKSLFSGNGNASGEKKGMPSMLYLIGLAACALLSLISIISVGSLKSNMEEMNQNMLSQFYQLQNLNQQLSAKIDELDSQVGNVSTTISESETSRNITITKEPTSTATYLNRGSEQDNSQNVPIFTVTATGMNLKFAWQRYDEASGSWVNLVFDEDSNNLVYGLHVYTDVQKGYTELAAHGVTEAAWGSYRCQISDNVGIKNTETVVLSEREA